jgi:ubiquinone/menaquinone biosynthesis C-methylase UbiE
MNVLDRAFGALYDPLMRSAERSGLGEKRRELLADLHGHVVEIGAGTGANLDHVPDTVELVTLLEPSPPMATRLRARVADRAPSSARTDITVLEAPAEALPLPDASADAVVSTLVLCSVSDLDRALAEIRRVLRPGGGLVLIEHVAADGQLGTVQRLLAPAWEVAARGCRLDRDTGRSTAEAGFDVTDLATWRLPGGGPAGPAIAGIAYRR